MRGVGRAESRRKRTHALVAVHLQIENVHDEGVAGLRAFNIKRSGERIVAFYEGERVAGLLQRVAKTVERICFQNISRLQARDRRRSAVNVFYGVNGGFVADGLRVRGLRAGSLRLGMGNLARQQKKGKDKYCAAHSKHLVRFSRESATQGRGEVNVREERGEERTARLGGPTLPRAAYS